MAATLMPSARVFAPRLAARLGHRRVVTAGLVLVSAAMATLSFLDAESSYWLLLAGLIPLGAGMGLAMTPATAAITDAVPAAEQGVGSAVNDLARELGGALGIAVLGSVLQSAYRADLALAGVPGGVAEQAESSPAVAARLGPRIAERAHDAFATGIGTAFLYSAITVAVTAVLVAVMLRGRSAGPAPEPGAQVADENSMSV
ncbi:MFS transporter [Actinomadura sp. LOL_016]|uniref:MFS transporter n=1 Tax=unclassified Actinomadura TaxID=2626254 RepID=UPI003A8054E4